MAATLSEFDEGFNAGLEAASNYHERKAAAADKCSAAASGIGDTTIDKELALHAISLMMFHRDHRNAIWNMRRQTDAEIAQDEAMEARFG